MCLQQSAFLKASTSLSVRYARLSRKTSESVHRIQVVQRETGVKETLGVVEAEIQATAATVVVVVIVELTTAVVPKPPKRSSCLSRAAYRLTSPSITAFMFMYTLQAACM